MTYIDLIRDAVFKLETGKITLGEYYKMTEPLHREIEQEPKTGRWEYVQYDGNPNIGDWHCSECNRIVCGAITAVSPVFTYKYCPECGARMTSTGGEMI